MDLIARNPYRVLGVFANDSNRIRTANIGKIRAFLKVGKDIHFDVDNINLLGPLDRSAEMVDIAIAQLSDRTEEVIQALFWFHSIGKDAASIIKDLSIDSTSINHEFDSSEINSYAEVINASISALALKDYKATAKHYTALIESPIYLREFREALNFPLPPKGNTSNKTLVQLFLNRLAGGYPDVDWWSIFKDVSRKKSVLAYIKTIFEKIALAKILENIERAKSHKSLGNTNWLKVAQQLKDDCNRHISTLQPLEGKINSLKDFSAETQLVLDKFSEEIIRECKIYYEDAKVLDEESVIPTLNMIEYALSFASSNEVIEKGTTFQNDLKHDVELLPPAEVKAEANAIKHEIKEYCNKSDEIQWALLLVENCIPKLRSIKEKVGARNAYYINISTKIAGNAIYNSSLEVKARINSYNKTRLELFRKPMVDTLRRAWELILYLRILDVSEDFRNGKLVSNEKSVEKELMHYNIVYTDIKINVSLLTEEEIFRQCNDYESIVQFCIQHPNSPFIGEAILKKWEIEANAFPKEVTVKNLLEYKEKYPNSHKDSFVLSILNSNLNSIIKSSIPRFLGKTFSSNEWTISDYKHFLRLYPNNPKKQEILNYLKTMSFNACKSIEDYGQYLKEFKKDTYNQTELLRIDRADSLFITKEIFKLIMDKLEGLERDRASLKLENIVYDNAEKRGRYEDYLKIYPMGLYADKIRTKQDRECFKRCRYYKDYKNYLKKYPKGYYSDIARGIIRKRRVKTLRISSIVFVLGLLIFFVVNISSTHTKPSTIVKEENNQLKHIPGFGHEELEESTNKSTTTQSTPYDNIDISSLKAHLSEKDEWGKNSLQTGAKPYSRYFGKAKTGKNYFKFITSKGSDYVVMIKRVSDEKCVNHTYIKGGENATLYVPSDIYNVYFYSGVGWNPNKKKGNLIGGFVSKESLGKDEFINIASGWCEYTLYPVKNGNFNVAPASEDEMFN